VPLGRLISQLTLTASVGGDPVVQSYRLEEALDRPYALSITFAAPSPDLDLASLLGCDATLTLSRAPLERRVTGIVRAVKEGDTRSDGTLGVGLEIVPALYMLSLWRNTRMFQGRTAPEILDAVLSEALGPYGREVRSELDPGAYPAREYCLQYQETDLAFVSRLMEEEGIHYAFDHEGDVELLVLRDSNDAAEPVPSTRGGGVLSHQPHSLVVTDEEPVYALIRHRTHHATGVTVRDFDWTRSALPIASADLGEDELGRTRESYEHGWGRSLTIGDYDAGARRYQREDGARQATVRREAHAARDVVGHGVSRVIGLQPGARFQLAGHDAPGLDDAYLVTRVVHTSEPAPRDDAPGAEEYHNVFECIPRSVPHRPARRTPKPRIASVQTAIVTGPAGEEIHCDEWGRVTVRFPWDRENPADDSASTWLRVQQKWAGAGWGTLWVPRVGTEVVVQFVDGDPDRPLVTGCLYDANLLLPYDLPAEKTKSTIKTRSSPGGGGFNEIRFEDRAGSEEVFIHSQKDTHRVTLNDDTNSVGHDQTITVGNDQAQTVGVDQAEEIGVNQTMTVGANRAVTVSGSFSETIDGSSTITVRGHATETLHAGETQTVNAGRTETVSGGETRTIDGGHTETVDGGLTQTVNGGLTQDVTGSVNETFTGDHASSVGAAFTHSIDGGASVFTPGGFDIITAGSWNLTAPPGALTIAPGGYTAIAGGGHLWIEAMNLELPGAYKSISFSDLTITGLSVSVKGAVAETKVLNLEYVGVSIALTGARAEIDSLNVTIAGLVCTVHGPKLGMSGIHIYI